MNATRVVSLLERRDARAPPRPCSEPAVIFIHGTGSFRVAGVFCRRERFGEGRSTLKALETPRLRLDPQRAEHAEAMFDGLSRESLYEFLAEEPPASVGALRKRYARLESRRPPRGDGRWLNWVVLTKPELRASGYVQATVSGSTASIAYVLFEHVWGRGFAREAAEAMLGELRDTYSVLSATATVDPRNRRSIRLLEQLGFTLAGTRRGAEWVHGILADEARFIRPLVSQG